MRPKTAFANLAAFAAGIGITVLAFFSFVFNWYNVPLSSTSPLQTAAAAEATDIFASTNVVSVPSPLATSIPQTQSAPSSVRTYTNAVFDFSLTYPSGFSVQEYDEGDGTKSIIFQKGNEPLGFQMFITPDPDEAITLAQTKSDFPALTMQGTESVTIGTGTPALAFASDVPDFGQTRELWFTHDGYLFEITTYPNLAEWLKQIIDTIRFP